MLAAALLLACAAPKDPAPPGEAGEDEAPADDPDPDTDPGETGDADDTSPPPDTGEDPDDTAAPGDDTGDTPPPAPMQEWLGLCDAWDVPTMESLDALAAADPDADDAVALSLGYLRPHRPTGSVFAWSVVQPEGAGNDWTLPDHVVNAAAARGLGIVATLHAEADVESDSATVIPLAVDPEAIPAWLAFVRAAVERYDGDGVDDMPGLARPVVAWQIGNESTCRPESIESCGADFTELMKRTYTAAKSASPDTLVVIAGAGPVFTPTGEVQTEVLAPYRWFFEHGGAEYTDAFDFHVQVGSPVPPLEDYLALWREVVGDAPLWVGETGTRSAAGSTDWPAPSTEAAWMTDFFETARIEGVERVLWCRGGLETVEVPIEVRDAVRGFAETLPPG